MYLFSCRLVCYPPSVHQLMHLVTCSIDFLLASIQVKIYKVIKGESVLYLCRAINGTKVHGSERSCGWHAVLLLDSQTTHELLSETTCGVLRELVFVQRVVWGEKIEEILEVPVEKLYISSTTWRRGTGWTEAHARLRRKWAPYYSIWPCGPFFIVTNNDHLLQEKLPGCSHRPQAVRKASVWRSRQKDTQILTAEWTDRYKLQSENEFMTQQSISITAFNKTQDFFLRGWKRNFVFLKKRAKTISRSTEKTCITGRKRKTEADLGGKKEPTRLIMFRFKKIFF